MGDIELSNQNLDKSQIGCYVNVNNRLLDVMVLSDTNYHIKIPITSKTTDSDKIQIVFKTLAGGDSDEPIGKKYLNLAYLILLCRKN